MTKKLQVAITLTVTACTQPGSTHESGTGQEGITVANDTGATGGTTGADGSGGTADDDGSGDSADNGTGPQTHFDVGAGDDIFCKTKPAGWYCDDDNNAIQCDDLGHVSSNDACNPDICLSGAGCVKCLDGQYDCQGNMIMQCNTAVMPPQWQQIGMCDPNAGMGCDLATGTCVDLQPLGGTEPTGVYYMFAHFVQGVDPFVGGYDVDTYENTIYVNSWSGMGVDVYTVELDDTDQDGKLEPNQHPMNPDNPGEVELRFLTFVQTIPWPTYISISTAELYAMDDRFYQAGPQVTEYMLGPGTSSVFMTPPTYMYNISHLGFDDINGVWYGSNENQRVVSQYDIDSMTWGLAFEYPPLAGDHLDGMEVVTDPSTGTPYVYVSDMTSDFIGQYRKDRDIGWVQENLFSYVGAAGEPVEGMGFGALNHFWATGGNTLYEIGGGDLAQYTEPPG